jgi:DNA-binding LacI/PurR family transcriptional regulator
MCLLRSETAGIMISPINRPTVVSQITGQLRQEIAAGRMGEWLPSERYLAEKLQVSRTTVRVALEHLKTDGLIRSIHGQGNRALGRSAMGKECRARREVALLAADALENLRPAQTVWIDDLRAMLAENGYGLQLFTGPSYLSARPETALRKLVTAHKNNCWILVNCREAAQRWFMSERIPCLIAGTPAPGVQLPSVDTDYNALCRHAAGMMLSLGHHRLGLLMWRTPRGGDIESERGFREGVAAAGAVQPVITVLQHDDSAESVDTVIKRKMVTAHRPTALLVPNPHHYLTVSSRLSLLGLRVPEDVSLISRDDDRFLSFLRPQPARYQISSHVLAKQRLRFVLRLLRGDDLASSAKRLMPDFVRGGTLAPPKA